MAKQFKDKISLDIRDSKPDWEAFLAETAPTDAPNVLVILHDDTGQAAWASYGGRIVMPPLDRLAKNGLTYTDGTRQRCARPPGPAFSPGATTARTGSVPAESALGFPSYSSSRSWGGRIVRVIYDVAEDVYIDVERQLAAAMA